MVLVAWLGMAYRVQAPSSWTLTLAVMGGVLAITAGAGASLRGKAAVKPRPATIVAVQGVTGLLLTGAMHLRTGTPSALGLLTGWLAMQGAALWWVSWHWPAGRRDVRRTSLREASVAGLVFAIGFSALATLAVVASIAKTHSVRLLWVYPTYLVAGQLAALCYWALQRIRAWATGRYVLCVLVGAVVYAACTPLVMAMVDKPMSDPGFWLVAPFLLGGVTGPAVGMDER